MTVELADVSVADQLMGMAVFIVLFLVIPLAHRLAGRTHDCARHGHRLESRYDHGPARPAVVEDDGEMVHDRRWVCDVCTACGKTFGRPGTGTDGAGT